MKMFWSGLGRVLNRVGNEYKVSVVLDLNRWIKGRVREC